MKRNGDIASLFRKHAAKKIASSSSPSPVAAVAEEQTQEQESTSKQERVIEEIVNLMPSSPPSVPLEDVSPPPPIYDINRLPHDPVERLPITRLVFRGHAENEESSNRENFLELLKWLAANGEEVNKYVLKNAPETRKQIIEELGDEHYAILADVSSDVSHKEQLALCLRYVDRLGRPCEHFLGVVHVDDTTSLSLKEAIQALLVSHHLTITQIRGQGYDGASNMKGEIKGLKILIMKESPSAYYVHYFAHQLQLVLVAVAKENDDCVWFFDQVSLLLSIIGVSCKRHGMLRNVRLQNIFKALECGELETGSGLNQEMGAHLMLVILGYTNDLSQCLQRRDQDILNAMSLVSLAKSRMQQLRSDGWDAFLQRVTLFCNKHGIEVLAMEGNYVPYGRSTRFARNQTNDDHFRREVYIGVIDQINQELDSRFDEVNMELLSCMSALNPADSFVSFDADKVRRLAEFYPNDISSIDLIRLEMQLDNYIDDMRRDDSFKGIDNLVELSIKLVETKKDKVYDLVYLLLKLVLLLPMATASVERVFSAMSLVKSKLRNRMGDSVLDDCLVTFIERDIFFKVNEDDIIETFMSIRRCKTNKN
ncbi:uncharacterized protein LOC133884000 [Phragmites australis]|uniref:uncharacterized protein LOC133884000 n=1 Tax=Phragmites australis TaxID=29695 RepID=UPI002D7993BB|nr:uncharacterized protein LOC133884000 [Phragmites australis]